jgi:hypothetical protein
VSSHHLILAMRVHLAAAHHGGMDPRSGVYCIRISGHLGATVLQAFPALTCERRGAVSVLTGPLDQSALYGVLAQVEALGLELLEVCQVPAEGTPRPHGSFQAL